MLQGRAGGGGARLGLAAARTVRVSGYISGYISGGGARAISRGEARISAGEMRVLVAHRWVLHPRLEPGVIKSQPEQLGGHGARYVRQARGWYA